MKEKLLFVCVSVLLFSSQSCSTTEEIRFEDMTEYELTRYNLLQSTPDQVVCFGPSRGFINGRFQRTEKKCFTNREIQTYSILTRSLPNVTATTGGFETDNGEF